MAAIYDQARLDRLEILLASEPGGVPWTTIRDVYGFTSTDMNGVALRAAGRLRRVGDEVPNRWTIDPPEDPALSPERGDA